MIIHGACNKVTCMNMTMHMMIMRMQNDKRHKCNMTKMGMAMQYNQMMNMMQEAKYDNGTHRDHGNKQFKHTTTTKNMEGV